MAPMLRLTFLLIVTVTIQLHHVDSQLSASETELSQIIKLLEEVTGTSASLKPNLAILLTNHDDEENLTNSLLQNNTDKLDKITTALSRIEEVLKLQQEKQDQAIITQTRMVESLDQIVNLLQIKNQTSDAVLSQPGNTADGLVKQQLNMSSPTPTIVETTSSPITHPPIIAKHCSNIFGADNQGSGVYTIDPRDGLGPFQVYCNMDWNYGWTVFQKRFDGSVDFFIGWLDYEQGFGDVQGEHWLGLQQLHRLTSSGQWTLRIELEDFSGNTKYAQYENFQIGDATSFYRLSVGAFSGNVRDSLYSHGGCSFSTKDSDHDTCTICQSYDGSCALKYQGGWWYSNCLPVNLNGLYQGSSTVPNQGASEMSWLDFPVRNGYGALKKSEMKIRRVQ